MGLRIVRAIPGVIVTIVAFTDVPGAIKRVQDATASISWDQVRTGIVVLGVILALIGLFWEKMPFRAKRSETGKPMPSAHYLGTLRLTPGITGVAAGRLVSGHPFLALHNDGDVELTYRVDEAEATIDGRKSIGGSTLPLMGAIPAGKDRHHGLGEVRGFVAGSRVPERIRVVLAYGPVDAPALIRGSGTLSMSVAFADTASATSGQVASDYSESLAVDGPHPTPIGGGGRGGQGRDGMVIRAGDSGPGGPGGSIAFRAGDGTAQGPGGSIHIGPGEVSRSEPQSRRKSKRGPQSPPSSRAS